MTTDDQALRGVEVDNKIPKVKKKTAGPPPNIEPKPKLSKAERRAIQEKQRADKAGRQQQKQGSGGGESIGEGTKSTVISKKQPQHKKDQTQILQPPKQSEITSVNSTTRDKLALKSNAQSNDVNLVTSKPLPSSNSISVPLVSHLSPYQDPSTLFRIGATIRSIHGDKNLHPLVIHTGYLYATGHIRGGNARCRAMLRCYARLIRDFVPTHFVHNEDLRHVIDQVILKPAFQYWTEYCRPHSVSMGNAFSFLKTATASSLDRDMTWSEMSETLQETLLAYERERIDYADFAIAEIACQKILFSRKQKKEVFLTFGNSEAVRVVLQQAKEAFTKLDDRYNSYDQQQTHQLQQQQPINNWNDFRVIVVDSRPLLEGRAMLHYLRTLNIDCTYCLLSAVTYVLKDVTKVLLGAASLSSDGSVFGRVGSAAIAMAAHHQHIPVLILSETYKISNRVFTGSITSNEIGNPDDVFPVDKRNKENNATSNLKRLNLLYDLTPAEFVSGIVTELGIVPPTSIAVLLREMNPQG